MRALIHRLVIREHGASATEYAILVSLIAAVIVGAIFILGGGVNGLLVETNTSITNP